MLKSTEPFSRINGVSSAFMEEAYKSGKFIFLDNDLKYDQPQATIYFDRAKASSLCLNMNDIGAALATMLGRQLYELFQPRRPFV